MWREREEREEKVKREREGILYFFAATLNAHRGSLVLAAVVTPPPRRRLPKSHLPSQHIAAR